MMIDRRTFLGSAVSAGLARGQARAGKPNVVIFLADDLGYTDVGFHGARIQTPHIDELAKTGVEMTRCYAAPLCSPMRAGLMTGRSQVRYGVLYNVIGPYSQYGLPVDEHILPQSFQAAGYQTAICGKWHLGHSQVKFLPNQRGFDHFYGHVNGAIDYFTHERDGALDWQRNGKSVREEGYTTELLAKEAMSWIEKRDASRPFLLYMPFNAPHSPLQAPPEVIEKYKDVADERRRTYMAMVDVLDQSIGKVLGCLDRNGLRDNTLVVFLSDNGGPLGQGATNGALRAGKSTTYEGGIRVPAVWNWPGHLTGGRKVAQPTSVQDIFPTLCEAAGVKPGNQKAFDGESVWQSVRTGKVRPHRDMFFGVDAERGPLRLAVISDPWKLVRDDGKNQLFKVDEDPNEKNDLAAKHPEKLKELTAKLDAWHALHPPYGVERNSKGLPAGAKGPKEWTEVAR